MTAGSPASARSSRSSTAARPPSGSSPARAQECCFADFGLPAADGPTAASSTVGIDREMTDLSGESMGSDDRAAGSRRARLRRRPRRRRRPSDRSPRRPRSGIRRARRGRRRCRPRSADRRRAPRERLGERHVDPSEIRRSDHHSVECRTNESRHRHAAADQAASARRRCAAVRRVGRATSRRRRSSRRR